MSGSVRLGAAPSGEAMVPGAGGGYARASVSDPARARPDALQGSVLADRWRLSERLRSTTAGVWYAARHVGDGRAARALIVHAHLARSGAFAERFAPISVKLRALHHPNVLELLDHGVERSGGALRLWQVHEAAEGVPLAALAGRRALAPDRAVDLIQQVLDALAAAGTAGVLHGELGPQCVLVRERDDGRPRVKVAGFAIAGLVEEACPALAPGPEAASPAYWAPERLLESAPSDAWDGYAAAVMLYELLTGERPWQVSVQERMRLGDLGLDAPSARRPRAGIGKSLDAVVVRALAADPKQRFGSPEALRRALDDALAWDATLQTPAAQPPAADEPLPEQEPVRARSDSLFGRDAELELLRDLALEPLERATHTGRATFVLGDAGIGKSALVQALLERIADGPLRVFVVEGRGVTRAFGPFVQLFRDLLGVERGAGRGRIASASAALGRAGLGDVEIERVIDLAAARRGAGGVSPQVAHREATMALRSAVWQLLSPAPALLVVEDADALDPGSRTLVGELMAAAGHRAFGVLLTARSDPWPEWMPAHARRIALGPLPDAASARIAEERLPGGSLPEKLRERLLAPARGSPWLIELRARALGVACGGRPALVDGKPVWLDAGRTLAETPRDLVSMVLRGAPRPVRRWISAAALLGRRVPVALLDALEPAAGSKDAHAARCEATGLVERRGDALCFRCEATRVAVQDGVPPEEARGVHRWAARWLSSGDPPRGETEAVAHHLERAGELAAAAQRYEAAGRDLLAAHDGQLAAPLLAQASGAWAEHGDPASVARVLLALAEACVLAGNLRAAQDALERVLGSAEPVAASARLRVQARLRRKHGQLDEAAELLEQAIAAAASEGESVGWYDAERELVEVLLAARNLEAAREHALAAVEVARTLDAAAAVSGAEPPGARSPAVNPGSALADAWNLLGRVELETRKLEPAAEAFGAALREAEPRGASAAAACALANLAHLGSLRGHPDDALTHAHGALVHARRAGDREAAARIALNLGSYRLACGDRDGASASFQEARSLAQAVGWDEGARLAREAALRS
jgi:tetratricopeptide (TPR) repeat protein